MRAKVKKKTKTQIIKSKLEGLELPLVMSVAKNADNSCERLIEWLIQNNKQLELDLQEHGAILFRGFDLKDEWDFENVVLSIDKKLGETYLGTSPRDKKTKYVHTASELPSHYPIMQHAEMSFLKSPPKKLFFFCKIPPSKNGETPITDLRKVYLKLDAELRSKFEEKEVKYLRRYDGPNASRFSLWKTKRWDEMFSTKEPKVVEEKSKQQGFEVEWQDKQNVRLVHNMVAVRKHPITRMKAWHNHSQTFHVDSPRLEYWKIFARQKTIRSFAIAILISVLTFWKKLTVSKEKLDIHTMFGDGTEISKKEISHIMEIFWQNMNIFSWQKGDLLYIDNYSVSHGRLPFRGPREILVAWTD